MWKSLHAAAFYTPGSPPHSASRQHWGQLIWLISPLVSGALLQGRTAPGKLPHPKIPGTHSGMPGIFLLRSDGDHAGGALPISTAAAAEGGKLSLYGLLPGAGGLLTDPLTPGALLQGGAAPGKLPPSKNPRHSLWNAGDFFPFTAAVPGVTSARRSHGLPL